MEGTRPPPENHRYVPFRAGTGWVPTLGLTVVITITYFLAARLGLALRAEPGVAVFWPAAGIAVGALIAWGPSARLPVAAAVVVATAASNLMVGRNASLAIAFGLFNAAQSVLTAWLIERAFGSAFRLENVPQVLGLLVASAIGAAMAAACAAIAVSFVEPAAPLLNVWRLWFASCLLGIVTVAPLLIGLGEAVRDPPPPRELIEGAVGLVTLAALSVFVISLSQGFWATALPAALVFPLLLWVVVRCRPVFAAAAAFVVALAVIWSTTFNMGHFGDASIPLADRILAAQTFVLVGALLAFILAALFAERRRSEAALGESDTRLRSILDAANVIAWDVDLISNTVHSAGPVGRLLDRPEGSVPRDFAAMVETIHPEDRDSVMAQFWTAVSTAATYRLEFRLNSSGDVRWVTAEGSIERDTHGRPVRVRGITHDITERKKAELALAERDAQLQLAGKAARVGSFVIDIDTGRVQNSPGYATIHGLAEGTEELPRDEWRTRVHPDDLGRLDALRSQTFAEQRHEHNTEYRIVAPDGNVRWIESRALVSYDGDGRPTRMVGVNIDIMERKRAEEHQNVLIAELDHRVKNVLASVAVVARRTSEHNGSTRDFIEALDRRIQSMADTHDLLSRNRWQKVSLVDLVRRELAPYATADNAMVQGRYVGLPAAAALAIAMVLHELATNAAKYGALSTPQGRVSVRWDRQSNGGVPARLRLEWREDGGPAVNAPGPGYGTSVIRDLIPYELGGTVELEFRPDGVCCIIEIAVESDTDHLAISRTDLAALQSLGDHDPDR